MEDILTQFGVLSDQNEVKEQIVKIKLESMAKSVKLATDSSFLEISELK